MSAIRVQILDALTAKLRRDLGVGKSGRLLREIRRAPWQPDALAAPSITVSDAGSRRVEENDGENQDTILRKNLTAVIVLDLPAQWDRDGGADAYAGIVEDIESIVVTFAAYPPARALGVIAGRVVQDEPVQAILASGESRQIWTIDIEIEHAARAAAQ